jgi:hypothetical protein
MLGTFNRGASGPAGTHLGTITQFRLSSCLATALGFDVRFFETPSSTWNMYSQQSVSKGQRYVPFEIRMFDVRMIDRKASGLHECVVDMLGTLDGAIDTADEKLIFDSNEILLLTARDQWASASATHSCGSEIWTDDFARFAGTFDLDINVDII